MDVPTEVLSSASRYFPLEIINSIEQAINEAEGERLQYYSSINQVDDNLKLEIGILTTRCLYDFTYMEKTGLQITYFPIKNITFIYEETQKSSMKLNIHSQATRVLFYSAINISDVNKLKSFSKRIKKTLNSLNN